MTLPEAIVYLLASSNHGMKTEVIARLINEKGLFQRWDGKPVDGKQVYACVMAHPDTLYAYDNTAIRFLYSTTS